MKAFVLQVMLSPLPHVYAFIQFCARIFLLSEFKKKKKEIFNLFLQVEMSSPSA